MLPIEQALRDAHAVVLLVDHRAFKDLDVDLAAALVRHKRLLDARNAVDRQAWRAAGFEVGILGVGATHAAEHVRYASDSR